MIGVMTIFNNPSLLNNARAMGYKIVDMSETSSNPEFLTASLLLPRYEAINELINGNEQAFNYAYWNQLASEECEYFISAIYTAMLKGINIAVFLDNTDDLGTAILVSFAGYINNSYGVSPELPLLGVPFGYNDAALIRNLNKIYTVDLISGLEYLMLYPGQDLIDTTMVAKLIYDVQPHVGVVELDEYVKSLTKMKNQMHEAGMILDNPFITPSNHAADVLKGGGVRSDDSIYW